MTLKELFSGLRDIKQLLKSCIVVCVCFIALAVVEAISYAAYGMFPLRPYIILLFGLYQLLCLVLAYRIIKKK